MQLRQKFFGPIYNELAKDVSGYTHGPYTHMLYTLLFGSQVIMVVYSLAQYPIMIKAYLHAYQAKRC